MLLSSGNIISERLTRNTETVTVEVINESSKEEKEHRLLQEERRLHQKLIDSLIYRTEEIQELIIKGEIKVTEIPNPHWNEDSCIGCHTEEIDEATSDNLRSTSTNKSCMKCHSAEFDHSYIHPVNIKPSGSKVKVMTVAMRKEVYKSKGKVSCSTCHDITLQCNLKDLQRHENKMFFRNGPYVSRFGLCNECHESKKYKRLNPHEHVGENGEIKTEKCQVCHSGSIIDLKESRNIEDVTFHTEKNLESICWGCHKWNPHPGGQFSFFKNSKGPDHLVKPSEKVLFKMERTLKEKNILMPLEPETGRVYCATCHNPHEKGVIKNKAAAKGAGSKKRLRSQKLCINCHTK